MATRLEIVAAAWELAQAHGIGSITLSAIGDRIGMRAPSLYTHFASKAAIYDAMFEQGWRDYLAVVRQTETALPAAPRAALAVLATTFFDFGVASPARYQLLNQRVVPGFEPTPPAFAPAVEARDRLRHVLDRLGVADPTTALDLLTALIGGLVNQQLTNEPGGHRWRRLLTRTVDMLADSFGVPGPLLGERA